MEKKHTSEHLTSIMMVNLLVDLNKERRKRKTDNEEVFFSFLL